MPKGDAQYTADSTHAATGAVAVTKSDTTVFQKTRALWVGGAGDVAVRMINENLVTFTGVQAGTILPVQVDKVLAATTATSILALY